MPFSGFGKRHRNRFLVSRAEEGKAPLTLHHAAKNPSIRYTPVSKRVFHRDRNYAILLGLLDSASRTGDLMVRGMSNREIAASLFITESTVKFHVTHVLGKLNAEDRTQAVITALKRGLAGLQ